MQQRMSESKTQLPKAVILQSANLGRLRLAAVTSASGRVRRSEPGGGECRRGRTAPPSARQHAPANGISLCWPGGEAAAGVFRRTIYFRNTELIIECPSSDSEGVLPCPTTRRLRAARPRSRSRAQRLARRRERAADDGRLFTLLMAAHRQLPCRWACRRGGCAHGSTPCWRGAGRIAGQLRSVADRPARRRAEGRLRRDDGRRSQGARPLPARPARARALSRLSSARAAGLSARAAARAPRRPGPAAALPAPDNGPKTKIASQAVEKRPQRRKWGNYALDLAARI